MYNFDSHLTFCNPSINLSETSFITELNRSDTVHHILIPTTHRYMYHFSTGKTEIMQIRSVVHGYNLMSLTMYVQNGRIQTLNHTSHLIHAYGILLTMKHVIMVQTNNAPILTHIYYFILHKHPTSLQHQSWSSLYGQRLTDKWVKSTPPLNM